MKNKGNILEFFSLGTKIRIYVADEDKALSKLQEDFEEIKKIYERAEDIFSRFEKSSFLSKINGSTGVFLEVPPDFLEISKKCLVWHEATAKVFDPRIIEKLESIGYDRSFENVGFEEKIKNKKHTKITDIDFREDLIIEKERIKFNCRMDFSGIVKGWLCDRMADFLKKSGYERALIDNGGDIFALGSDAEGDPWHITLEGFPEERFLLKIRNEAVATSGITRRKWEREGKKVYHIINPKDLDSFPTNLQSVSVVAKKTEEADVWAKTLFVLGIEKGIEMCERRKMRAAFLDYRGNITVSKEMKNFYYNNNEKK